MRIFCVQCRCWYDWRGMGVSVGNTYRAYRGDRYVCSSCGNTILADFGEPYSLVAVENPESHIDFRVEP